MGFYSDWRLKEQAGASVTEFITDFLSSHAPSLSDLYNGDERELNDAYCVLSITPLSVFLLELEDLRGIPDLCPRDIPCFSNMEKGASRLNELLLFAPEGLTLSEIGYQLMNSTNDGAQKKYGENHSKLAESMSLVLLSNKKPIVVVATAWGNYLTRYSFNQKKEVIKKLLLRDRCIQSILSGALKGSVNYKEIVSFLSNSTKIRRRTNVRYLINFILSGSEYESTLSNINWEVE